MLSEEQRNRIKHAVQNVRQRVSEYRSKKTELEQCTKDLEIRRNELSKVANEEQQTEIAMEVLYGEGKGESQVKRIEQRIDELEKTESSLEEDVGKIRNTLMREIHEMPIPVDLDNFKGAEHGVLSPYLEGAEFGEEIVSVMCELLGTENGLEFHGVEIQSHGVLMKNTSMDSSLSKLVEGIKAYRMKLEDLLNAYEQIDDMVERALKSEFYPPVLAALLEKEKLSTGEIAEMLKADRRRIYDACFNLTRDNWIPHPIQKNRSGEWELTLSGEILANRLLQRHPEKQWRYRLI